MQFLTVGWHSILSLSTDIVIVLIVLGIFLAYALYAGKQQIAALLLSLPTAVFLFLNLPYKNQILGDSATTPGLIRNIAVFLVLIVPTILLLKRFLYSEYSFSHAKKIFQASVFALTTSGIVLSISQSLIPVRVWYTFSTPSILWLFANPLSLFIWIFGSILVLWFFIKN